MLAHEGKHIVKIRKPNIRKSNIKAIINHTLELIWFHLDCWFRNTQENLKCNMNNYVENRLYTEIFLIFEENKAHILGTKNRAHIPTLPGSSPGGSREFEGWTALAWKDLFVY